MHTVSEWIVILWLLPAFLSIFLPLTVFSVSTLKKIFIRSDRTSRAIQVTAATSLLV